jgi:hypothetical protein
LIKHRRIKLAEGRLGHRYSSCPGRNTKCDMFRKLSVVRNRCARRLL